MTAAVAHGGVALELQGVGLRHPGSSDTPEVEALVDVSLAIAPGELVSVCGPSGSGKSTLLNIMGALAAPTSGRVVVDGQQLDTLNQRRRAALRSHVVGFVFQSFNLLAHLSVAQNVALPAILAGRPQRDSSQRALELLDLVGLADKGAQRAVSLSGGEQQRVAIARALVNDPKLVLADEPTGNLDSRAGAAVADLLHACHDAGRTVVIVTHDMRLASQAQRVVHLRDGRIVQESRPRPGSDGPRPVDQLLRTGRR
ncbi:MAG: ABC transporter ATP-binding protein [Acidimicrobiales bacterium]